MGTTRWNSRGVGILAVLGLAGFAGACSTVSPEEMDAGLANLRAEMLEEMQAGDQTVSQRLGNRMDGMDDRMAQLDTDIEQLESDFEVRVQRLEDELRFDVPVYFAFDDATVENEDEAVLDRFGAVAQKYYPEALITVEGFTDAAGTAEYNLSLGQRRAEAVANYLVASAGIAQSRIRAVSYGENTQRLVTPDGWGPGAAGWENRRVVLVIDHNGMPPSTPRVADISEDSGT